MTTRRSDPYFEWLISQIEIPVTFNATFDEVFDRMYHTPFVWTIPEDNNRTQDGRDLQTEFGHATPGVSVLEVLIGLSRRVAFVAGGRPEAWAWRLFENLGLNHFADPLNLRAERKVEDLLQTLLWRTYSRDGRGGFFPLVNPVDDQTTVEIWYQMQAYVLEIVEA